MNVTSQDISVDARSELSELSPIDPVPATRDSAEKDGVWVRAMAEGELQGEAALRDGDSESVEESLTGSGAALLKSLGDIGKLDGAVAEGYDLGPLVEGVSAEVTPEEKEQVRGLLHEFRDIFSRNEFDIGETNLGEHAIDTGDAKPIRQPLRRHPQQLLQDIDTQVQKMVEAGIVEKSASPWASNLVMVRKKDGSYRMCVDMRGVNTVTRKDAYPLPRIDACLDALTGSKFYSTFDLTSGYFQVRMSSADADKTSFITRAGSFRFRRMTMGLCNAGSTFSRIMQIAMQGLNFSICLCYLDDVIVFAKDVATHIERLRMVFQRLREAGLKLKPSKCHLIKEEVGFLGHVVSAAGVATDERKVKAVREWPVPRNVHELRAFIGLCSYYRRYIAMFSVVCAPLHALTGKNVRFVWSEACDEAFQQLKDLMTSAPILAMPTDEDPYTLDVDASGFGIGAVLSQCQQGEERVICYASRSLSKAERNYCCTRRELLAVVYLVKYFRPYLLGRKFLIRTDHSALTWLRKTPEPIGQQARWCEILEEFDFDIHHRPGKVHGNADALSRKPCKQCGWGSEGEDALEVRNIVFNAPAEVADSQWSPLKVAEETEHDDELGPILKGSWRMISDLHGKR
jgi:hypothetical protein